MSYLTVPLIVPVPDVVNPLEVVFNQLVSHQSDALAATFTSALIAKCYQPIEAFTQSINLFHLGSTNPDVYEASKTYVLKALSRVSLDVQSSSVEFLLQTNDNDIQFAVSQQLKQSMSANKNNPNYIIGYMLNPVYLQSNIQNIRQVALDNHLKECKRTGDYSILKSAEILIVEDSDVNIFILAEYFNKWNLSFESVNNGENAIERINKKQFDIVLMDLQGVLLTPLWYLGSPGIHHLVFGVQEQPVA